eukprot:TRINITY_DN1945_c0_g1_i1.p1 TRINITY_DN1945_c0_g1~~TRINITY_DN1945_c0_g1_i1.p1  ORF type:complete len:1122 (+),score=243.56 TRINITY_DN1945_c0_g1_i1:49-3414(+)
MAATAARAARRASSPLPGARPQSPKAGLRRAPAADRRPPAADRRPWGYGAGNRGAGRRGRTPPVHFAADADRSAAAAAADAVRRAAEEVERQPEPADRQPEDRRSGPDQVGLAARVASLEAALRAEQLVPCPQSSVRRLPAVTASVLQRALVVACSDPSGGASAVAAATAAATAAEALLQQRGFNGPIHLLVDGRSPPTRAAVVAAFDWLLDDAQAGSNLVLVWCGPGGHGGGVRPSDWQTAGDLSSRETAAMLLHRLPPASRLTVVADGCPQLLRLPHSLESGPQGLRLGRDDGGATVASDVAMLTADSLPPGVVTHALCAALQRSTSNDPPMASLLCQVAAGCRQVCGGLAGGVAVRITSSTSLAESGRFGFGGQAGAQHSEPRSLVIPAPPASAAVASLASGVNGIAGASRAVLISCVDPSDTAAATASASAVAVLRRFLQRQRFHAAQRVVAAGDATAAGIADALAWLGAEAQPGDSLFLGWCGGGAVGGGVRAACGGLLGPDELRGMLLDRLPAGVRLTAVLDGAPDLLRLPHRVEAVGGTVRRHAAASSSAPHVCSISAASAPPGALVTAFAAAVNLRAEPTYAELAAAVSLLLQQEQPRSGAVRVGLSKPVDADSHFHLGVLPAVCLRQETTPNSPAHGPPEVSPPPTPAAPASAPSDHALFEEVQRVLRRKQQPPQLPQPQPEPAAVWWLQQPETDSEADAAAHLEAFYRVINPQRMPMVPTILREYDGQWGELYADLEDRYECAGYFARRRRLLAFLRRHAPARVDEVDAELGTGAFGGGKTDPPCFAALSAEFGEDMPRACPTLDRPKPARCESAVSSRPPTPAHASESEGRWKSQASGSILDGGVPGVSAAGSLLEGAAALIAGSANTAPEPRVALAATAGPTRTPAAPALTAPASQPDLTAPASQPDLQRAAAPPSPAPSAVLPPLPSVSPRRRGSGASVQSQAQQQQQNDVGWLQRSQQHVLGLLQQHSTQAAAARPGPEVGAPLYGGSAVLPAPTASVATPAAELAGAASAGEQQSFARTVPQLPAGSGRPAGRQDPHTVPPPSADGRPSTTPQRLRWEAIDSQYEQLSAFLDKINSRGTPSMPDALRDPALLRTDVPEVDIDPRLL